MKIKLNSILSTNKDTNPEFTSWESFTKGAHTTQLDINKGMPYVATINGRIPIIGFHNNPFEENKKDSPWRDLIFQEEGRVIYNGDNKSSSSRPETTTGNKKTLEALPLYNASSIRERLKAPPIFVTQTVKIGEKTGYRKFIGFGLISEPPKLIHQYEKGSDKVFSNYQYEVTLLRLGEDGEFDWAWIDDRRNPNLSDEEALIRAPDSWKKWVKYGPDVLPRERLTIKGYRTIKEVDQKKGMSKDEERIIDELLKIHYPDPSKDGIRFEAMASFLAEEYFKGFRYKRGWITKSSGDRGVDFVGRLDIGHDDFSKTSLIVLGQSKRYKNSISGERLTRVASRMNRGYIGVVITLDTFSEQAQEEIRDDKLPIILINGKKVAELLLDHMHETKKSLSALVAEQDEWAKDNIGTSHYDTILWT